MKIGFVGLGIMGRPMAKNLLAAGVELLVNDLNAQAVADVAAAGAQPSDLAGIGKNCEIVITMLPNGSIVKSVLFGENGVASTLKKGSIVCDMSSVTASESRECAAMLAEKGVKFIDAPVSGGEPGAIGGTLAIMAGGDPEDFERMKPYFDILGKSSVLVGSTGSGSVTKLVNQAIVNLNIVAVSEAFVLAAKAGADLEKVYQAICGGLAGSQVMHDKIPMILERNFKPGGKISINHKDIKNVLDTAHALDVPMPFTAQLFELQQAMKVSGNMNDDHCGYVKYFERLAGVEVKKKDGESK